MNKLISNLFLSPKVTDGNLRELSQMDGKTSSGRNSKTTTIDLLFHCPSLDLLSNRSSSQLQEGTNQPWSESNPDFITEKQTNHTVKYGHIYRKRLGLIDKREQRLKYI